MASGAYTHVHACTYTHTHAHTYAYTHRLLHESNFKKPGTHRPAAGACLPGLKIRYCPNLGHLMLKILKQVLMSYHLKTRHCMNTVHM